VLAVAVVGYLHVLRLRLQIGNQFGNSHRLPLRPPGPNPSLKADTSRRPSLLCIVTPVAPRCAA
jgi:hypothetical protein